MIFVQTLFSLGTFLVFAVDAMGKGHAWYWFLGSFIAIWLCWFFIMLALILLFQGAEWVFHRFFHKRRFK